MNSFQAAKKCEAKYKELRNALQERHGLTRDELEASKCEVDRFIKRIVWFPLH